MRRAICSNVAAPFMVAKDVPRHASGQRRVVGPVAATDDPTAVRLVKLEEERLSLDEIYRLPGARLPEVDLLDVWLTGEEVEPVPVRQADPEPHPCLSLPCGTANHCRYDAPLPKRLEDACAVA